jgi:hypothetical protein
MRSIKQQPGTSNSSSLDRSGDVLKENKTEKEDPKDTDKLGKFEDSDDEIQILKIVELDRNRR